MGISIGMVGLGAFGSGFVKLFARHPLVDRIGLCDREPDRVQRFAEDPDLEGRFAPKDAYASLDGICESDLDALVIMTQPWLHAPQCVQAMEAGKHVYSAVPILSVPDSQEILGWVDRLVETCRRTGQYYMLGETTYYRPQTMFCRHKAAEGAFGDFVYAEGEYFHDVDAGCNLRRVQASRLSSRAGEEWRALQKPYRARGCQGGPMHYPTHSTSGPISVMGVPATKATCYGFRNRTGDPYFANNAISNEVALFEMANGASMRICEFREVARAMSETFRVYGTKGSYREGGWETNHRDDADSAKPLELRKCTMDEMRDPLPEDVAEAWRDTSDGTVAYGGHGGSHAYLVHEFVDAVAHTRQPAINVWQAARYMAAGVTAHQSALKDGERLDVPDWGEPPG